MRVCVSPWLLTRLTLSCEDVACSCAWRRLASSPASASRLRAQEANLSVECSELTNYHLPLDLLQQRRRLQRRHVEGQLLGTPPRQGHRGLRPHRPLLPLHLKVSSLGLRCLLPHSAAIKSLGQPPLRLHERL